jgi:ubiquinone/menaquinone biosynthesis C-methylase UbiE
MKPNKHIERNEISGIKIFDNRSLEVDYRTLQPILKKGMSVLDIGCGTGAISKDVANIVGPTGKVIGIDNTEKFINSGRDTYKEIMNLELIPVDLFDYQPKEKFDLIIAARVMQWQSEPKRALIKIKSMLKPYGQISILDYNHDALEWDPEPPESMLQFYKIFLKWRADAGFNNNITMDLPELLKVTGFRSIEKINSDEYYHRDRPDFSSKVGIWSKVASSKQMVNEGYLDNDLRLKAIDEYDKWVKNKAITMTMKLNEIRAKVI